MEDKEKRVRAITHLYYSNKKVQEAILNFSENREVVPRYYNGFGKRPDSIQYPSDINGLIKKGATSLHCSEEIWFNPLEISSEMNQDELNDQRKGWDLLIDIDSPFLDCSKIAAELIIKALEIHGIKNYGIKFSGSKGFHIIIGWKAFPKEFNGENTKDMFPEWPRIICTYLMNFIRKDYDQRASVEVLSDVEMVKNRTNLKESELLEVFCNECEKPAKKAKVLELICPVCKTKIQKKNAKSSNRKLKCVSPNCTGYFEILEERDYFYCENCKDYENEKIVLDSERHPESFDKSDRISANKIAGLDLVLVAPRHLFRMPYSLHEKTALASVVLNKEEIHNFNPKDADPLKVEVKDFYPDNNEEEAKKLLSEALDWKKFKQEKIEEKIESQRYKYDSFKEIEISGVEESMFPKAIKKLLKGLKDGKKRGLFVLITFLKSLNFTPEYINNKIREWNKLNEPPLKEGYVKSQIDWHFKQRKKILPPNYSNQGFYSDLGLLDEIPKEKNPIVEVLRKARKNKFT